MNMIMGESGVDPLAVYAAHSFADDQSYQVSQWLDFREGNLSNRTQARQGCLRFTQVAP
jgi:hypothetical protein